MSTNSPEYSHAYYLRHKTEINIRSKAWQASNPDKKRISTRESMRRFGEREWALVLMRNSRLRCKTKPFGAPTITAEWILEQYVTQDRRCYWTGVEMLPSDKPRDLFKPSLDRLNNTLGYTPDNVVLCTMGANYARNSTEVEQFRAWLDAIKGIVPRAR